MRFVKLTNCIFNLETFESLRYEEEDVIKFIFKNNHKTFYLETEVRDYIFYKFEEFLLEERWQIFDLEKILKLFETRKEFSHFSP